MSHIRPCFLLFFGLQEIFLFGCVRDYREACFLLSFVGEMGEEEEMRWEKGKEEIREE